MNDIKLEELIRFAMQDGVVNEKERAILIKKAVSLGIDPDEFEMVLDARIQEIEMNAIKEVREADNLQKVVPLHDLGNICKGCGNFRTPGEVTCVRCGYKHKSALAEFKDNLNIAKTRAKVDADEQYAKEMEQYEKKVKARAKRDASSPTDGFLGFLGRVTTSVQNMVTAPKYNEIFNNIHQQYRSTVVNNLDIPSNVKDLRDLLVYFHENDQDWEDEEWHAKKRSILTALESRVGFIEKIQLKKYRKFQDSLKDKY
ncbi:MAG: hypothetical protein IKC30_06945 [Rikenellaceae bacterium]|nr:hypothetical protein [Rikenellaceae bacterium]